ncbi:hypothetical protein HK101_008516 [Irineochytrium annulatum]|nr:hypothetical protein HK101_008516 [Irineochytrium annulatum]
MPSDPKPANRPSLTLKNHGGVDLHRAGSTTGSIRLSFGGGDVDELFSAVGGPRTSLQEEPEPPSMYSDFLYGKGNALALAPSTPSSGIFSPPAAAEEEEEVPAETQFHRVVPNFVSKHVKKYCDNLVQDNPKGSLDDFLKPSTTTSFAAVVMADVSGYSSLSAILAERGPIGAELLGKTMKGYLDRIIATIEAHGGDIVKFAGDAVIVCWKMEDEDDGGAWELPRAELVLRASYCCMDLLNNLGTYVIDIPNCATKMLRIHLGIGAGNIFDVHLGGEHGRWEHFITGDAVKQLSFVLDLAKAGELAMSHAALKWFSCVVDIDTINIGDYDKRCVIIHGLEHARRKFPIMDDPKPKKPLGDLSQKSLELYKRFINDSALFKLQADINQSRLFRLQSDLNNLLQLHELRQVTTVFIRLEEAMTTWDRKDMLPRAQDAMNVIQIALKKYEGCLRQVHVDDKGAVALAFFGLPPLAHQNDASYGVKAVLDVRDQFVDLLDEFAIGITTGVVSIGGVGNASRTEYAVMGDSINMAARLMCHPQAASSILCDEKTYNLCENEFNFERLGEARIKGKSVPINIFRPTSIRTDTSRSPRRGNRLKVTPIGRTKERLAIKTALKSHLEDETAGVVILEADGGQGLSTLVNFAKEEAVGLKCHVCASGATEMEKSTPYFIFRDLICDLLGLVEDCTINEKGHLQLSFDAIKYIDPMESSEEDFSRSAQGRASYCSTIPSASASQSQTNTARNRRNSTLAQQQSAYLSEEDLSRLVFLNPKPEPPPVSTLNLGTKSPHWSSEVGYKSSNKLKGQMHGLMHQDIALSDSIEEGVDISTFEAKAKAALVKLREPLAMTALFDLIMPFEFANPLQPKPPVADMPFSPAITISSAPHNPNSTPPTPPPPHMGLPSPAPALNATTTVLPAAAGPPDPAVLRAQPGKIRMKELSELLRRIINALSLLNPVSLIFNEAQWMDTLSWELLWEIVNTCPRTAVFIFTRPERSYDNEDRIAAFRKFKRLPRTTAMVVEGLSMEDTRQLVVATWPGKPIKGVVNAIAENIYRRTNGNPLYIKSLMVAWKESGQWRVDGNGFLAPPSADFDFDSVVVGYDLKSIVVAHFDRLDRNFQLFLKVSSVLGQRFLVEDVLFFLSDMPGFKELFGGPNTAMVLKNIEDMDKYGYLQRIEGDLEALYFQFKSAVVRNCIYSMMADSQRQQLHLRIARYYERMLNPDNCHRLLIPLYEHYNETGHDQRLKKLQYLEEVCHFYYQKHSMTEAIKHYNLLLLQTAAYEGNNGNGATSSGSDGYDRNVRSRWNRELGEAYFAHGDVVEASVHLCESLRIARHAFPSNWFSLFLRTRSELSIRSRFSVPGQSDSLSNLPFKDTLWCTAAAAQASSIGSQGASVMSMGKSVVGTQSGLAILATQPMSSPESAVPPNMSSLRVNQERSANSLISDRGGGGGLMVMLGGHTIMDSIAAIQQASEVEVAGPDPLLALIQDRPELGVLHGVRLALMTLSEVKLMREEMVDFRYAILRGLNLSERFPRDSLYSRFLSMTGYMFWLMEGRRGLALKYLDAADRTDQRSDLGASAQILCYTARTLFLMGIWEESARRYEAVLQINPVAGDITMREEAMRMKSIMLYHTGPRAVSSNIARDLYALSIQEDHWAGKFWGCFMILANLLSTINSLEEIQDMRRCLCTLWSDAPPRITCSIPLQVLYLGLLADCDYRLGLLGDRCVGVARELEALVRQLKPHSWIAALGCLHATLALYFGMTTVGQGSGGVLLGSGLMRSDLAGVAGKDPALPGRHHAIERYLRSAEVCLKRMKGFAMVEAIRLLNRGVWDLTRNKRARAVRFWKRGLALKGMEGLVYLRAILNEQVAKYEEDQDQVQKHLKEAQKSYRRIGATWNCERLTFN